MKEDIAKRWAEELRSGNHKQGHGRLLCGDGSMCCLGVLQGPVLGLEIKAGSFHLSDEAIAQSGLSCSLGHVPRECGGWRSLSGLNDEGKSFREMADIVEANWKTL